MENDLAVAQREQALITQEIDDLQRRKTTLQLAIERGEPDPERGFYEPAFMAASMSELDRYITDATQRMRRAEKKVRQLRRSG